MFGDKTFCNSQNKTEARFQEIAENGNRTIRKEEFFHTEVLGKFNTFFGHPPFLPIVTINIDKVLL